MQLWHAYLRERRLAVRGLAITDPTIMALNNTYERSLVSMHKMPRVWLEYLVRAIPCCSVLSPLIGDEHICVSPCGQLGPRSAAGDSMAKAQQRGWIPVGYFSELLRRPLDPRAGVPDGAGAGDARAARL